MAIRCDNCKQEHANTQKVRECYATTLREGATVVTVENSRTALPASNKQVAFLQSLLETRSATDKERTLLLDAMKLGVMTMSQASKAIDMLLGREIILRRDQASKSVPAGRYAVELDGVWHFLQVDHGKGRWEGHVFLSHLIGSPGDYRKEPVKAADARARYLGWLAKDPRQASINYGKHKKTCGVCNSPLTNEESRELGIGPKCRENMGW